MGDLFGVAVNPFELDEWQQATGIKPDLCMVFENWARQRTLTDICNKAKSFGHTSIAVTWEPWKPTPVGTSAEDQGEIQVEWCNEAICAGRHDGYIDAVAQSLRDSKLNVYLRYGHEMNGNWYPWHNDPESYVEAWRYVRNRVRMVNKAWNVKFVWAPNPDLWRASPADWLSRLMPYWPPSWLVEYVGFTMIDFGGDRYYPVSLFAERFNLARQIFQRPILGMEVNVARENAVEWLYALAGYIRDANHPLPLVILSQGSSRAAAVADTGELDWSVSADPAARDALREVVRSLHQS